MKTQALICDENRHFTFQDVTLPEPGDNDVVIRNLRSGVSVGTEFALIHGKISWGPYPLCTGYMGVGEIKSAGKAVTGFKPGDCVYYRDNKAGMKLADGTPVS